MKNSIIILAFFVFANSIFTQSYVYDFCTSGDQGASQLQKVCTRVFLSDDAVSISFESDLTTQTDAVIMYLCYVKEVRLLEPEEGQFSYLRIVLNDNSGFEITVSNYFRKKITHLGEQLSNKIGKELLTE